MHEIEMKMVPRYRDVCVSKRVGMYRVLRTVPGILYLLHMHLFLSPNKVYYPLGKLPV